MYDWQLWYLHCVNYCSGRQVKQLLDCSTLSIVYLPQLAVLTRKAYDLDCHTKMTVHNIVSTQEFFMNMDRLNNSHCFILWTLYKCIIVRTFICMFDYDDDDLLDKLLVLHPVLAAYFRIALCTLALYCLISSHHLSIFFCNHSLCEQRNKRIVTIASISFHNHQLIQS